MANDQLIADLHALLSRPGLVPSEVQRLAVLAGQACARLELLERRLTDAEAMVEQAWIDKGIASLQEQLGEAQQDVDRVNWMERHLCRAGEVKNAAGQTVKLARVWSIMGELETLRETIDAARDAQAGGPE